MIEPCDSNGNNSSCCDAASSATQLNQSCYCTTLDKAALYSKLDALLPGLLPDLNLSATYQQFFSNVATFMSQRDADYISESIRAIEGVIKLDSYKKAALGQAHPNAQFNPGTAGAFIGYDFHLTQGRPQLIEINTNAGGGFLNKLLHNAQRACCPPMQTQTAEKDPFKDYMDMFLNEWRLQRGDQPLKRIAIVDADPEAQFLFTEFKMAQSLFNAQGIEALIASPDMLSYRYNQLYCEGKPIDLVYNRLTDFIFNTQASHDLNEAYQQGDVVVTPAPYHYALYADKRNLTLLSDEQALRGLGVSEADITILRTSIPHSIGVSANNAAELWERRRQLFFKPASGYGSKATYRGDKLTKGVWEQILKGQYIAQENIAPSERQIVLDGQASSLKMDVRAYSYQGKIQLMAARLYQGQTTNFRTPGGGFSPIFIT